MKPTELQAALIEFILYERQRQIAKWGKQDNDHGTWKLILDEELGEAAKAILENRHTDIVLELIESAAVLLAWLENYVGTETIARCFESHWIKGVDDGIR